jgi:hypothetical protein
LGRTRTLAEAARRLGKQRRLLERWSAKRQWVFRADQWDAELQRQSDEAAREHAREQTRAHLRITARMTETIERLVERLLAKIEADVNFFPSPERVITLARTAIETHRLVLGLDRDRAVSAKESATALASGMSVVATLSTARTFHDSLVAFAERLPPQARKEIAEAADAEFIAGIEADIAKVEAERSKRLPRPPLDARDL